MSLDESSWVESPADAHRIVIGVFTFLMMTLSWPLWVEPTEIPRVPFVWGFGESSPSRSWISYFCTLGCLGISSITWRYSKYAQICSLLLMSRLVFHDQHRFQPWIYLYVVMTLLSLTQKPEGFIKLGRFWYSGLYFHSGLSKLDLSFRDELGTILINTFLAHWDLDCREWSSSFRTVMILSLPLSESLIGILLLFQSSRKVGVLAAIALHISLLVVFGPLGLGHSLILLAWNVAMLLQVWIIFHKSSFMNPGGLLKRSLNKRYLISSCFVIAFGWLAPFGERLSWFDPWPSHALYASHVPRLEVFTIDPNIKPINSYIDKLTSSIGNIQEIHHRLDLTDWSTTVRGTPVYPGIRAQLGIVDALSTEQERKNTIVVIESAGSYPWTAVRVDRKYQGTEMIRLRARQFWINSVPFVQDVPHD